MFGNDSLDNLKNDGILQLSSTEFVPILVEGALGQHYHFGERFGGSKQATEREASVMNLYPGTSRDETFIGGLE
jgi:hypothetical protein